MPSLWPPAWHCGEARVADIDMIPRSWREGLRVRRTLGAYGAALAALLVVGGGASAWLHWRVAVETPLLEAARATTAQVGATQAQLVSAQARKDALADQVAALAGLRGAGEVAALARVLDHALNERVWFETLRLARTQEALQSAPSPLPPDMVQARAAQTGTAQAWRLGTQVEIAGGALDNAAMTAFLAALAADPALSDVRFLNSSTAAAEDGGAVGFNASAALVKQKEAP